MRLHTRGGTSEPAASRPTSGSRIGEDMRTNISRVACVLEVVVVVVVEVDVDTDATRVTPETDSTWLNNSS